MAVNPRELGHAPAPSETQVPADNHEAVLFDPARDNVGLPDFAAFAQSPRLTPDTPPIEELYGFAAYQKAGGVFSEVLYKTTMNGVIELQKPGARENSNFSTGTEAQIKGFEDRHNRPFLGTVLSPEKQVFLTEVQKDAYRLLRSRLSIPEEDRQKEAYFSDLLMFEDILKMPTLESYSLSKQEQPQTFPAAA